MVNIYLWQYHFLGGPPYIYTKWFKYFHFVACCRNCDIQKTYVWFYRGLFSNYFGWSAMKDACDAKDGEGIKKQSKFFHWLS